MKQLEVIVMKAILAIFLGLIFLKVSVEIIDVVFDIAEEVIEIEEEFDNGLELEFD